MSTKPAPPKTLATNKEVLAPVLRLLYWKFQFSLILQMFDQPITQKHGTSKKSSEVKQPIGRGK